MVPEDIAGYIENLHGRFAELEAALADPAIYARGAECRRVSQEHRKLETLFRKFDDWRKALAELADNREMLTAETDAELRELIAADIADLEERAQKLEADIQISLLPPDPNDAKNIIVGIKPAAGGDEAALFAGELFRAYMKFAEKKGWRIEVLDQTDTELGGIKDVSFSLSGDEVYSLMKYESGVHRVQRVPATEAGGRIHTSTVTVAVMPEAEEVELDIRPEDLRFDVFRSSGPGGQCVNTTDSAVRVTHIPTGIAVASQQEKSQHRNKEIALRILYARLLEHKQQEEADKQAADKRSQVGTGDRSERIRTYNFPQNRVTDHRFNVNTFDLPKLMEGELDLILDQILMIACERRLDQLRQA
ncbi:peptide chain release factor 1 [Victivallis vadensis]|uniref:Peptide chain release factor 1 n=1 Tax=Victivallis vadensis TaxID=172901 RepID=A0A2U1B1S2_9BACT|nr:peptide chain release factor 1 [Victivallis vadensis]PVY42551.1 peptide chain release factor 1 (bRF-1) [Victivallis vadensis]